MNHPWNKRIIIALFAIAFATVSNAQNDSLGFKQIVSEVLKRNPLLKQNEEKVTGAQLKEELAKSSYLPSVSGSANVNRLYPIPAFEFAGREIQMVPDFGMDFGVKATQLLYDFGKTKESLALQQENTEMSKIGIQLVRQRLSMLTANYFYALMYVQSAISIKNDELITLKQHLEFVENRQKTGSATQYEILSTKVRISVTETQLFELKSNAETQLSHLNNLMDTTGLQFGARNDFQSTMTNILPDSSYNFALNHRDEISLAERKISLAEWNYKIANSQNKPVLLALASTGFKNGYLPEINSLKFNYMIGLSLNIPIFDGNRKNINSQIAASSIGENRFELENLKNSINDEVKENYVALQLAQQKINQYRTQQEQALEAYNHAQTNYQAGAITNLDLLDAFNALSESKLLLLKAQIDYKFYELKYKAAIGERLDE